jgi:hypothetical protein
VTLRIIYTPRSGNKSTIFVTAIEGVYHEMLDVENYANRIMVEDFLNDTN